ncbi:MAG: hypothetical protein NWE89_12715 [Candidatus Bathyarchaeota archaeon]|nr:hypothetical protein [Candidatus Bathyarchaeota archaeon]
MSLNIPDQFKKYIILTPHGDNIDRFKCPVPGCEFTTRLGPGALRMHLIMKADPNMESRYDIQHKTYYEENSELDSEMVKALAVIPRAELTE